MTIYLDVREGFRNLLAEDKHATALAGLMFYCLESPPRVHGVEGEPLGSLAY